jgi:hypothetical protein
MLCQMQPCLMPVLGCLDSRRRQLWAAYWPSFQLNLQIRALVH